MTHVFFLFIAFLQVHVSRMIIKSEILVQTLRTYSTCNGTKSKHVLTWCLYLNFKGRGTTIQGAATSIVSVQYQSIGRSWLFAAIKNFRLSPTCVSVCLKGY